MSARLQLDDVAVRRGGATILEVAHLTVPAHRTVAILGPNGAGKSTLLRVAGRLVTPDEGQVLLDGAPAGEPELRAASAAVLQRPLLRRGTVLDNAASGLRFRGVPRDEARRRAHPWLDRLGIAHLGRRAARSLSGGEGQRVSLARALATEPRLLLLDEPFAALDEPTRASLVADVGELIAERRITTLLVTHDRREAAALADRIVVLDAGRIRADAATAEILRDPVVADLIGGSGLLDAALAAQLDPTSRPAARPVDGVTPPRCR